MIADAASGQDGIQQFRKHRPDVTLMDLRLPDMNGVDTTVAILAEFPEARIIMLTTFEGDVEIQRALEAGARGYMLKSMPPKDAGLRSSGRCTPEKNAFPRNLRRGFSRAYER